MHKLKGKKEGKMHYFHHVKESDGSKKHVYLGSDRKNAEDRLTKLRVARIRSDNKLINEMEKVQVRLHKLGAYDIPYDSKLSEVRQQMNKKKNVDRLLRDDIRQFPVKAFVIFIAVFIAGALAIVTFSSDPALTGAAVAGAQKVVSHSAFSMSFVLFTTVAAICLVLYAADYQHRHRHDKYKPPM
ncbi:hypothetical protein KY362_01690 [Candidatus Woesearchaeota archaeon]|nr:hypothetical protein [Candidatus Woesearchaeota archaeon]